MRFYLGTHMVNWLWDPDPRFDDVTFFVSRTRLARRATKFPRALHDFCLDSGGFTELQRYGRWTLTAEEYVAEVRRYRDELGPERMLWAAPQDLMCEEIVIRGGVLNGQRFHGTRELRGLKPGDPEQDLTTAVRIHQRLTVDNAVELRRLAPDLPFIRVLQGRNLEDYKYCAHLYAEAGFDLAAEPVVGLGSVCRRQGTEEIGEIVTTFAGLGLNLHGFGVKSAGIAEYGDLLISADSMAWSFGARREPKMTGCRHRAKNCANCPTYALAWRSRVLSAPAPERQLQFDLLG